MHAEDTESEKKYANAEREIDYEYANEMFLILIAFVLKPSVRQITCRFLRSGLKFERESSQRVPNINVLRRNKGARLSLGRCLS